MIHEDFSHWSEFEFCMEGICRRGYEKTRKYSTPQAAWDAWDDAGEMLWCLTKRRYDKHGLVRCGLTLVLPVLPILYEAHPRTELFVQAKVAVRDWLGCPTSDNKSLVASFLRRMKGALEGKRIPYHAANCIYKLGQCVFRRRVMVELPLEVAFALIYAAKYRPAEKRLLPEIPNDELSLERIVEYQSVIVRKHFPAAPALLDYD